MIKRYKMDQIITLQFLVAVIMLIDQAMPDCHTCTNDDLHSIKLVCQLKGQQLDEAETTDNATIVCDALDGLLTCVAEKVPQCLSKFGMETQRYRWTPWDCHLSEKQVFRYQEIFSNGCKTYNLQNVSVKMLPGRKSNRTIDVLQSSNLSVDETNSSSFTDNRFTLTIGIMCLHIITSWHL